MSNERHVASIVREINELSGDIVISLANLRDMAADRGVLVIELEERYLFSQRDIAQMLGMTQARVSQIITRARKRRDQPRE